MYSPIEPFCFVASSTGDSRDVRNVMANNVLGTRLRQPLDRSQPKRHSTPSWEMGSVLSPSGFSSPTLRRSASSSFKLKPLDQTPSPSSRTRKYGSPLRSQPFDLAPAHDSGIYPSPDQEHATFTRTKAMGFWGSHNVFTQPGSFKEQVAPFRGERFTSGGTSSRRRLQLPSLDPLMMSSMLGSEAMAMAAAPREDISLGSPL